MSWPRQCVSCPNMMRPPKRTRTEYPNTVGHVGKGRCATCASGARRRKAGVPTKRSAVTSGQRCAGKHCDRRLRPQTAPEVDHPGTWPHSGNGMCGGCATARRRGGYRGDGAKPGARRGTRALKPSTRKTVSTTTPATPVMPPGWYAKKPKPRKPRIESDGGFKQIPYPPPLPDWVRDAATTTVHKNGGTDTETLLKMLGLIDS